MDGKRKNLFPKRAGRPTTINKLNSTDEYIIFGLAEEGGGEPCTPYSALITNIEFIPTANRFLATHRARVNFTLGDSVWNTGTVAASKGSFKFTNHCRLPLIHPQASLLCHVHYSSNQSDRFMGDAEVHEVLDDIFNPRTHEVPVYRLKPAPRRPSAAGATDADVDAADAADAKVADSEDGTEVNTEHGARIQTGVLRLTVSCVSRVRLELMSATCTPVEMLQFDQNLLAQACSRLGNIHGVTDEVAGLFKRAVKSRLDVLSKATKRYNTKINGALDEQETDGTGMATALTKSKTEFLNEMIQSLDQFKQHPGIVSTLDVLRDILNDAKDLHERSTTQINTYVTFPFASCHLYPDVKDDGNGGNPMENGQRAPDSAAPNVRSIRKFDPALTLCLVRRDCYEVTSRKQEEGNDIVCHSHPKRVAAVGW